MAVDAKGNVYTAEVDNAKRIQKFKLTSDAYDRRIARPVWGGNTGMPGKASQEAARHQLMEEEK